MEFSNRAGWASCDPDMTPMIDVTFQLIIFFMLTMNFGQDEQSELIRLPSSDLAKPPDAVAETPITLQVTSRGNVILGGDVYPIAALKRPLLREKAVIEATPGKSIARATIIIRADRAVQTGQVQEVIKTCQDLRFEKFVLRAKQDVTGIPGT